MSLAGPAWPWTELNPYAPDLRKRKTAETALSHTRRSYHDHPCPRGTRHLRTCLRLSVSWCWGRSSERADGSPVKRTTICGVGMLALIAGTVSYLHMHRACESDGNVSESPRMHASSQLDRA